VTTDIPGQRRFTATIARRLDQLGALTKGQRDTASGVFSAKDNFENKTALDALERFYRTLFGSFFELKRVSQEEGQEAISYYVNGRDIIEKMGLCPYQSKPGVCQQHGHYKGYDSFPQPAFGP
jgi:hypothetical protein